MHVGGQCYHTGGVAHRPYRRFIVHHAGDFSVVKKTRHQKVAFGEKWSDRRGSFEEILKTTDPNLTVEQFGRRFMTERILVAAG